MASRVATEACAAAPAIEWPLIVGVRHRLVHAYVDADTAILLSTAQISLPPLLEQLRAVSGVA